MSKISRRNLIKKTGLVSLAGLGAMKFSFSQSSIGEKPGSKKDLLIYLFLNGGMDGLNLIPPKSGEDYVQYKEVLRKKLHINSKDSLTLNGCDNFGMHPAATQLAKLFNQERVAIVHATGMLNYESRSHFEATTLIDRGIQEQESFVETGWLTRLMRSSTTAKNSEIPLVVPTNIPTEAVMGDSAAVVLSQADDFALNNGIWNWGGKMQQVLKDIYAAPKSIEQQFAQQTLEVSDVIRRLGWQSRHTAKTANYPDTDLAEKLRMVACLCREDVGLESVYVPFDGWDTHVKQGTGKTGIFARLTREFSDALYAFYQDLTTTHAGQFTVIVQSEFGRRAYENSSGGTDHGFGNPMLVIGDYVNGGFYGAFPGLGPNQLFQQQDVAVNIDYRDVVSEVLIKRLHINDLGYIFPGYSNYQPLGLVNG